MYKISYQLPKKKENICKIAMNGRSPHVHKIVNLEYCYYSTLLLLYIIIHIMYTYIYKIINIGDDTFTSLSSSLLVHPSPRVGHFFFFGYIPVYS